MMKWKALILGCLAACAKPAPPPETPGVARTARVVTAHQAPADPCFATIDLRGLLDRHAASFGSEAQVEALLPRRVSATVEMQGSVGTQVSVYDRERYTTTTRLGGFTIHTGFDQGAWLLGPAGVVQQLEGRDGMGARFELWLAQRRYLSAIDPARDTVRCERAGEAARAVVSVRLPELGDPELVFDLSSAALTTSSQRTADGERIRQHITAWSAPNQSVRWPSAWVVMFDEPVTAKDAQTETRISCAACLAAPSDTFVPHFPPGGRVSVPLVQNAGKPLVEVRIGSVEALARLDSSANLSFMEASSPFAAAFKATLEAEATYAPERPVQIGVLDGVRLGGMALPHLPVVYVDTKRVEPAVDRPALMLGASLFGSVAVRIDYKAARVILAARADALHGAQARALALHHWNGRLVAELEYDGSPRFFEVQTGSADAITLASDPARPNLSGTLGNGALAGCAAAVFDVPRRTLWLEPPCSGPLSSASARPR
jgi:hypothetical protein